MLEHIKEYNHWLNSPKVDSATKEFLKTIENNEDELILRFGSVLEFGTAGLRGTMGPGTANMNIYTVAQATQGMANLIIAEGGQNAGVAIACDSRNNSQLFSETAASVLAANGIKTYIFDGVRPTPELSFAIRHLGCIAGINITASHNPKEYNGYKAYWDDGAQLPPEKANTVSNEIAKIDIFDGVKSCDYNSAVESGSIKVIGDEVDDAYIKAVLATAIDTEVTRRVGDDLKIVYTPLHGAGYKLVPRILCEIGMTALYTVDEQMILDGNFPTVKKPNPEMADVFTLGIELAERVGSDLVIATDPDSDRVGVVSRTKNGTFTTITGNQMGALLLDYVITARRATGKMPNEPYAVKSIVSSNLVRQICEDSGVKLYDVLTGFKFIGEVIKNHEEGDEVGEYIFGFEESYGYLFGSYARDKDAVGATMMICEMTAYYRERGMTLSDALDALYEKYGYFAEQNADIYMEGVGGIERRVRAMERLRKNPPLSIGGEPVSVVSDLLEGTVTDVKSGKVTPAGTPKSDVLSYTLECGDKAIVRPSGTEPKVKIYFLAHDDSADAIKEKMIRYTADADKLVY